MKKIFLILFVVFSLTSMAQDNTSAMLKQIALLQVYIGYIEKGYSIAQKGLKTIGDIKDGHWKMDIEFFNSLKNVNPKIRDYIKVAAIMNQQVQIVRLCGSLRKQRFNTDEVNYIHSVCDHIISECETNIDLLVTVLKDDELHMSDDERISAIDSIYNKVVDQYSFIKDFAERAKLLLRARLRDKNDINVLKILNGL